MQCPACKSSYVQKKGKRAGKQRYICSNCGAGFTDSVKYRPSVKHPELSKVECPTCHSTEIFRDGHLQDGSQRYKCKICGTGFSTKSNLKGKVKWGCPYCGGKLTHSGLSKLGMNEYRCVECGKSCTADEEGKPIKRELPFALINKTVKCVYCGSLNLRKAGRLKNGERYICNECKHAFTEKTKVRKNINDLIKAVLKGYNIKKVAVDGGYTVDYLRKVMLPYYKKEEVTVKQINSIIKYGYYLKVPIEYMAEYIKCSEHKCKEVISKYEKKIKSTNPCAI